MCARFLDSYLTSLHAIATHDQDPIKGRGIPVHQVKHHVSTCGKDPPNLPWTFPSLGRLKLSIDRSFTDGIGGAGMVLRDHLGSIIFFLQTSALLL